MQLAGLYFTLGDHGQAEELYTRMIKDYPDFHPALFALGAMKDLEGNKTAARRLYESVLQKSENYLPALNNLAYLLVENYGDPEGALSLAFRAYNQAPGVAEVKDTLGYVLVKNRRFEEAIPLLEKARDLLPENPTVQLHLAMAYQGGGKPDLVSACLQPVLAKGNPDEVLRARKILGEIGN
jgi:tetratricopeptide (TPR) repeat protein